MSKSKIILTLLLVGVVIGGFVAYKMWNKPHTKVEDIQAIEVSTEQLTNDFAADEQAANKKYLEQVINVTGKVIEAKENQDGYLAITLDNDILCTMRDKASTANEGSTVTIKGFCNGADLFGVVLSDCIIVN